MQIDIFLFAVVSESRCESLGWLLKGSKSALDLKLTEGEVR